jgi:hypothetical protein
MSRHLAWFFSAVVMLAVSAPLQALNYEVGGCKTGTGYVNFTTISAAVIGVPAGSKIQVCPGVYPEQVTITQPLTLEGIGSGNANRAVITINPNGSLAPNVTSIDLGPLYAQVLVQNVSPAGPVNMIGITVDGAGANLGCSNTLVGIFYASSNGTVNEVTARNQVSACGYGIWIENGSFTNEAFTTIENSSVHNQGFGGIGAYGPFSPPLTATISGNFLSNAGGYPILAAADGQISSNVVTSNTSGNLSIYAEGGFAVSGNTVADVVGPGIWIRAVDGDVGVPTLVESNKLSNVGSGIVLVNVATLTIKSNTIRNTVCAIDFGGASPAVSGNTLNDALYAFLNYGGSTLTGNSFYNVDNVQSANCTH